MPRWGTAALIVLGVLAGCREDKVRGPQEEDREGDRVSVEGGKVPGDPSPVPGVVEEKCPPRCPPPTSTPTGRQPAPNPIPAENARPGDADWRDGRQANNGQVELYASTESAAAGEEVAVRVSTDSRQSVTAEVYRLGHYGGAGARKVWSKASIAASTQAACPREAASGLIECAWSDTFRFTVGDDWVSGVYVIKVKRPDGYKRFAPLVVRDRRAAELLFQPAVTTYQAYNAWGGLSLYTDASGTMPTGKAFQVSFDRPYRDDEGTGQLFHGELAFLQFLERHGYDVTYATNLDFLRHSDELSGIGAFVNAFHDEYWSAVQRQQVDEAVAKGMSLAHFGGNGAYWRVRLLGNASGASLRTLVCYKGIDGDPAPGSTVRFRDDPAPYPENELLGSMYDGWQLIPFPLTVSNPSHWLYRGTQVRAGELLPGLVGNEFDRIADNGHSPAGLRVAAEGPVVTAEGVPSRTQVVDRTLPKGNLVFSAGTLYWPLALTDDPDVRDGRVERMTLNVLERALALRRPARALPEITGPLAQQGAPDPIWAQKVEALAGRVGGSGTRDGAGSEATFEGPTGVAVTADGRVLVTDTVGNRIRLIDRDAPHTVRTLAGSGKLGGENGPGAKASFRRPTAIVIGPDGAAYVADSDNHVIRRVELSPPYEVSVWAGTMRSAGFTDGVAGQARFRRPTALAVDREGNLFVADQANHRIRRIDAHTQVVSTVAGGWAIGFKDAPVGTEATFNNPSGLAVGGDGELFVFDGGNGALRRISAGGDRAVLTLAGGGTQPFGYADGPGDRARFRGQMGLAVGPSGELLLADTANYRLRKIVPGADARSTRVYTLAGSGRQGTALGSGDRADLVAPAGVAVTSTGRIVLSDSFNQVIRVITR